MASRRIGCPARSSTLSWPGSRHWAYGSSVSTGSRTSRRSSGRAGSTQSSWRWVPTCPSASISRPGMPHASWTQSHSCAASPLASGQWSGGASRCTVAAIPRWTPPGLPVGWVRTRLSSYRRTRAQMPAHVEEAEDAEREGVRINWLRTITAFDGPALTVEVMELDESGYPRPTGRFETLAADTVILALGQETDTAFLREVPGVEFEPDGTVLVSSSLMTGCPGVFAGGDMVPSERTVTVGVGHGKKAARHIDAYLRGAVAASPPKHE